MRLIYRVVGLIRRFYPDALLVAGLGELQDTEEKRIGSKRKGYMKGQPDLMVTNYHKDFKGLCIEFKSSTNYYHISEAQKEMKNKNIKNGYAYILSNDYDKIVKAIHEYMKSTRVLCIHCKRLFISNKTLNTHCKVIHRQ